MSSVEQDSHCGDGAEQDAPEAVVPGVVPSSNESKGAEITDKKSERFVYVSFAVAFGIPASVDIR